ncbi:Gfo/Idh/MocA family protein [Sphingopyxis fribergensis]
MRLGLLGCARIAKAAIIDAAPQVPGVDLVAVASRDGDRAAAYARRHGIARSYGSYAALVADPSLDAVYIPLPNNLHAEWAIAALNAGKAVLCEKPLAANAAEATRMARAAQSSGGILVEAVHYRFHPLARFVDTLLAAQDLGHIERVEAGFHVPRALVSPGDIRFDAALGGGAMMDVGTYCLGALRWITGEEPTILSAKAELAAPDVDCAMLAECAFGSGIGGRLSASLAATDLRSWVNVTGSKGTLQIDNPFLPHLGNSVTSEIGGTRSTRSFSLTSTYVFQLAAFLRIVNREDMPPVSLADSIAAMEATDAVYRAAGLSVRR